MKAMFILRFGAACAASAAILASCAPAPGGAQLTSEQMRLLAVRVKPPVACSLLRPELVNTYAGCEAFGGLPTEGKFSARRISDAAMMTAESIRCFDLKREALAGVEVCRPAAISLDTAPDVAKATPSAPSAPDPVSVGGTTGGTTTGVSSSVDENGSMTESASASSNDVDTHAQGTDHKNGSRDVSTSGFDASFDSDGNVESVSWK